jgi:hypothetical protein
VATDGFRLPLCVHIGSSAWITMTSSLTDFDLLISGTLVGVDPVPAREVVELHLQAQTELEDYNVVTLPFPAFDALDSRDDPLWTHGRYADGIVVITMDFQPREHYDPPADFLDDPDWLPLYRD